MIPIDTPARLAGSHMPDPNLHAIAAHMLTPGRVTTWLNHWSLLHADWSALRQMDTIGIDGTLLQMVLARRGVDVGRSSADLVLPIVLGSLLPDEAPVALIGAAPGVAQRAAARLAPRPVLAIDGYAELASLGQTMPQLRAFAPRLVIVGLGAGLQERVARQVGDLLEQASVCTAGGWIDQFAAKEQYFPPVVHRLRLGWAWRIAHEPRRLTRRYTLDAASFLRQRHTLLEQLEEFTRPMGFGMEVT